MEIDWAGKVGVSFAAFPRRQISAMPSFRASIESVFNGAIPMNHFNAMACAGYLQ
jgi:hypothetical protein